MDTDKKERTPCIGWIAGKGFGSWGFFDGNIGRQGCFLIGAN
jgi:hypothetical protein